MYHFKLHTAPPLPHKKKRRTKGIYDQKIAPCTAKAKKSSIITRAGAE